MKKQKEENIIWHASFPRSGNTWTRFLITDALVRSTGAVPPSGWQINKLFLVQDFPDQERDSCISLPYQIVKTHNSFSDPMRFGIYVFRRSEDCLTSYYWYKKSNNVDVPDIDEFCLQRIDSWNSHVSSWIEAKDKKTKNILFLPYERLVENTAREVRRIAHFLTLTLTDDVINATVHSQCFDKISISEKNKDEGNRFFRKGIVGDGKKTLKPSTVVMLRSETDRVYDRALSLATEQQILEIAYEK